MASKALFWPGESGGYVTGKQGSPLAESKPAEKSDAG